MLNEEKLKSAEITIGELEERLKEKEGVIEACLANADKIMKEKEVFQFLHNFCDCI